MGTIVAGFPITYKINKERSIIVNKWLQSSLIVSTALLAACASNNNKVISANQQRLANSPQPVQQASTVRMVRVAPEYREDAPDRYVVKRGDTLWDIAGRFLRNPGRWKEIWHANPQIKNPNLIYPGDVISYTTVGGMRKLQVAGSSNPIRGKFTGRRTSDGRPIYNVSPGVRIETVADPIPTVPKEIVYPFMTKNRVLEPGFSHDYPYVIGQADNNYISLSGRSEIYAKSEDGFDAEMYDVFREEGTINDPTSGKTLGVEAVYVGKLKQVKEENDDGIATFMQVDSVNPLLPEDILIPTAEAKYGGELNFLPKLPDVDDDVVVVRAIGASNTSTASQFSTLLINVGSDDDADAGDVFKIVRAKEQMAKGRDGKAYKLPDYEIGFAMVYRTFDDFSYALVMSATDVIYPGDRLVTP